ncbi:Uma2 family endonuclease [Anaerovorax odorimutans]|uniref:Uma2 family endonuclease n=1 Tax=Anaerovorax odorimutans TaxID=109327 RepID=A0ABT1RM78_9FIRM|nr:Uma2 family endonuclease [Anaerovorax odorimutans]MCQ4636288.1 Uma2 family endonuclease [Anaerovorax odorimutans]
MTIQEMKDRKRELGYSYARIANLSGVPLSTVQKIFNGTTSCPRYETLRALEQVLGKPEIPPASRACESQSAYEIKKQGEYTLEDYDRLPGERRVELIDGVFYDMPSPSSVHQLITGLIYAKMLTYAAERDEGFTPIISPIDVQLDRDGRTMVQPDVIAVCDRDKIISRGVFGAPDFVVEVLSKSTKKKDMVIKLNKYLNAGVREYWLIDPDSQKIMVYDFEHDNYPVIYGFDSTVPIAFQNHDYTINFAEIYDYIRFLCEKN